MNRRLSSTNLGRGSTQILRQVGGVQCTWVVKIDIYTGNAILQVRIDIYIGNAILQKAARFDRHIPRELVRKDRHV